MFIRNLIKILLIITLISVFTGCDLDPEPKTTKYELNYNSNGAASGYAPYSQRYVPGASIRVQYNYGSLALPGYVFNGWNTSADGSGTTYQPDEYLTMPHSDVVLYVRWTAGTTHTVTYFGTNADSGSPPTDANNYLEGATVTVLGNTGGLTRYGYTFAGWNTAANGSGTGYVGGNTFLMGTADVDLYAQWEAVTGTITINNPGSPTFSMSPTSFTLQTGGGNVEQIMTVTPGSGVTITEYYWYINGNLCGSADSITLNTDTNPGWFQLGVNTLTLIVVIDGMPYSDDFFFNVEQY